MRRRIPTALLVCLALSQLAATAGVAAAQLGDLAPGVRVRVRVPTYSERIEGVVLSKTPDTVVIATTAGVQHHVALSSLESMELFRGHSRSAGAKTGALWGIAIGGILYAPIAALAAESSTSVGTAAAGLIWTSTAYGMLGALIGTAVGADQWDAARIAPVIDVRKTGSSAGESSGAIARFGMRVPVTF